MTRWERVFKLAPAAVAFGLALIYILGAIAAGSEFDGAGVDPRDAVPLLSLQQILARGIGLLIRPSTMLSLLLFVLGLGALLAGVDRVEALKRELQNRAPGAGGQGANRSRNRVRGRPKAAIASGLVGAAMMLIGLFIFPLNQLPGALGMVLILSLAGIFYERAPAGRRPHSGFLVGALVLALVVALGVTAYTDPTPTPRVAVHRVNGRTTVRGSLITHNDSTWYLFEHDTNEIRALPDTVVDSTTVFKRPSGASNDDKNLAEDIWDGLSAVF